MTCKGSIYFLLLMDFSISVCRRQNVRYCLSCLNGYCLSRLNNFCCFHCNCRMRSFCCFRCSCWRNFLGLNFPCCGSKKNCLAYSFCCKNRYFLVRSVSACCLIYGCSFRNWKVSCSLPKVCCPIGSVDERIPNWSVTDVGCWARCRSDGCCLAVLGFLGVHNAVGHC